MFPLILGELSPAQHANLLRSQRRKQLRIPALILRGHKGMQHRCQSIQTLNQRESTFVRSLYLVVSFLDPLQEAGNPNLHELIQVARRDRQELYSLEERIRVVLRPLPEPSG